jgi:hypothetical protein
MRVSFNKILGTNTFIIVLSLIIIISVIVYYLNITKKTEGFYPVTQERIDYSEKMQRIYNDYSDMYSIATPTIIPRGEQGDTFLNKLLASPTYEGSADSKKLAELNYNNKLPYKSPPENAILMARIAKCESIKDWDCEAFNDPEFFKYCGICTKEGTNFKGKQHIGGLYIDPYIKENIEKEAKSSNKIPKYTPTAGYCKGDFLIGRPKCDIEKDRDDCSKVIDFKDPNSIKCALCANSEEGKFVYVGNRGNRESNYALKTKPITFMTRLRFAVSHPNDAVISVIRKADNKVIPGGIIQNTNIYICDITNAQENEEYNISVKYPEYKDYVYSNDEQKRLETSKKCFVKTASSGTVCSGNRLSYVNSGEVQTYGNNTEIVVINDGLFPPNNKAIGYTITGDGIPPNTKVISYRFDRSNPRGLYNAIFIGLSNPISPSGTFVCYSPDNNLPSVSSSEDSKLCNELQNNMITDVEGLEKHICETDIDGSPLSDRIYTNGKNTTYFGTTRTAKCIEKGKNTPRGIVGQWESTGLVSRTVPLAKSVKRINGFDVGSTGVTLMGTIQGSKVFKNIVPESKAVGIPPHLFWFWDKNDKNPSCVFSVVVPATLCDPTMKEDIRLCPSGPLISTEEGSKRLVAGACETLYNGKPQGPGNYSQACIQNIFLNSGCVRTGKAFPNSPEKLKKLTKNSDTGDNNDIDAIENILDEMYTIATTTKNSAGLQVDDTTFGQASNDCMGRIVSNPCDTPNRDSGPLSVSCLNYLYKNAGKDNEQIGPTYPGMANRSSGTGRTDKNPISFCQSTGSMAPIGADGKVNMDAVQEANSYGGVNAVREFYKQIHMDANYNTNPSKQRMALGQCYGVAVSSKKPTCKGTSARYVRIMPSTISNDSLIQISQLTVYDVYDTNVSIGKPVKSSASFGITEPNFAVDGVQSPRPMPKIWCSAEGPGSWWEVDLKNTIEIAYIVYHNRSDCCDSRSKGMIIQLLDKDRIVIKEKTFQGGLSETILFSNARPSGLLRPNIPLQFSPHTSPGTVITIVAGGEILLKQRTSNPTDDNTFISINGEIPGTFMFKHKTSDKYLRVQGFRLRASENDNTNSFKQEILFKVVDSLVSYNNEVSLESVFRPGSYLALADNNGVYISPAKTFAQQKACSWRITL